MFGANLALDGSGCAVESYHKFPVMANSINWIHFRLPTKSRKELEHASTEVSDWAILRKCKTNTYLLMREWPRQFKKLKLDPFILTRTACRKQTQIFQPHAASLIKLVFYNSGLTHRENDTHSGLHSPNHEKPSSVSRAEWDWNVYLTYIYMSTVGIALKRKKMSKRSISDALVCGSSLIRTF